MIYTQRLYTILGLFAFALLLSSGCSNSEPEAKQPNIIYILADDLGYGDLSCYGQTNFFAKEMLELMKASHSPSDNFKFKME